MTRRESRPNILILLLDSVPARRLGCYGYERPTTPNLDRMAAEGVRFADATSPGAMSPPGHGSLFTGLLPDRHGVLLMGSRLSPDLPTMSGVFSRAGYRTMYWSNKLDLSRTTGLDAGFDQAVEMQSRFPWPLSGLVFRARVATGNFADRVDKGAAATNRYLLRYLADRQNSRNPSLMFVNYVDAHYPYGAPPPFRFRFTHAPLSRARARRLFNLSRRSDEYRKGAFTLEDDDFRDLSDLFDGSLAYLDQRVGELLEELRLRNLLDRTIVVVLADHGEFHGDHGRVGHGQVLYESVIRVPLIIRWPDGLPRGVVERRPVQISDVFPTLLDLAGVSWEPASPLDGVSLVPREASEPYHEDLFAFLPDQAMIRRGSLKYIRFDDGREEVYDLEADPDESRNLLHEPPDLLPLLRDRLGARMEKYGSALTD